MCVCACGEGGSVCVLYVLACVYLCVHTLAYVYMCMLVCACTCVPTCTCVSACVHVRGWGHRPAALGPSKSCDRK